MSEPLFITADGFALCESCFNVSTERVKVGCDQRDVHAADTCDRCNRDISDNQ
jgi:hypothetical protein